MHAAKTRIIYSIIYAQPNRPEVEVDSFIYFYSLHSSDHKIVCEAFISELFFILLNIFTLYIGCATTPFLNLKPLNSLQPGTKNASLSLPPRRVAEISSNSLRLLYLPTHE